MPYGVQRNVAADLSAAEHKPLKINALRLIRRINPTCAVKKSNICKLISGINAPEGHYIGNRYQNKRNPKPQRGAILVLHATFTYITPLWGLERTQFGIITDILHLWCVFNRRKN